MLDHAVPPHTPRRGRRLLYALAAAGIALLIIGFVVWWPAKASVPYYSARTSLSVVAFPDRTHGWLAGDTWARDGLSIQGATIRATGNGGATWVRQYSSTAWEGPCGIAFANARRGWVIGMSRLGGDNGPIGGDENALFATRDGGTTWTRQASATHYLLTDVACSGPTHAWAVGVNFDPDRGVVLATSDGASWHRQFTNGAGNLWGVAFADRRHGWAVGDGVILGTSDGGTDWKRQGVVKGFHLRQVAAADRRHAWAIGWDASDRDVILATADGGATWKAQYSSSEVDPNGRMHLAAVAFAGASHGWVVGDQGLILATDDGGKSWKVQSSGTKADISDVAFADGRHGIAVGNSYEGGEDDPECASLKGSVILRTDDGGAVWSQ